LINLQSDAQIIKKGTKKILFNYMKIPLKKINLEEKFIAIFKELQVIIFKELEEKVNNFIQK